MDAHMDQEEQEEFVVLMELEEELRVLKVII